MANVKLFIVGQQAVTMWITALGPRQHNMDGMLPGDMCHTTESQARVNPRYVRVDLAKPFGALALVPNRQKKACQANVKKILYFELQEDVLCGSASNFPTKTFYVTEM